METELLLLLGLVLLLIAAARALGLSPLLALLAFACWPGIGMGWLRVLPHQFALISSITAVALFALIGAGSGFRIVGVGRAARCGPHRREAFGKVGGRPW